MELDDLILLYNAVKRSEFLDTQDRFRLEHRLELMIDFYSAKEKMNYSRNVFEQKANGKSVIKLD